MASQAIIEKVNTIIAAPSACAELKEASKKWLDAVGTDAQEQAAKDLIAELEEDVLTSADLMQMAQSERGKQIFGEEKAAEIAKMAQMMIDRGENTCPCPGCQAGQAVLDAKEELFG